MKMETTTLASTFGRLPSSDKNGGIGNGRRQWTKKNDRGRGRSYGHDVFRKKNEEEE